MGSCASYGFLKSPSLPGTILAPSSNLGEEGSPSASLQIMLEDCVVVGGAQWLVVRRTPYFLHLASRKIVNRCCHLSPLITPLWTGVDVVILGTILKLHLTPGIGCKTWVSVFQIGALSQMACVRKGSQAQILVQLVLATRGHQRSQHFLYPSLPAPLSGCKAVH